jgi:hypothetical protein
MPDEFAAVGLFHALSDSGAEMGFFLNEAQSGVFYQSLRVGAGVSSNAGTGAYRELNGPAKYVIAL